MVSTVASSAERCSRASSGSSASPSWLMELATSVANSISQDGDALLPLLALEHRSSLLATVLTTVPALVVGLAFLVLT